MSEKSHPEVQKIMSTKMYHTGEYLMISGLLPLFWVFKDLDITNPVFPDSHSLNVMITFILLIVGAWIRTKAKNELNLLFNQDDMQRTISKKKIRYHRIKRRKSFKT